MGDCNNCVYSSLGRFEGAVKLYCGLSGMAMDCVREACERIKERDSLALEVSEPAIERPAGRR